MYDFEAILLFQLSSNSLVVNFTTEKVLSFQVWNKTDSDPNSFQLITEWNVKANHTGLQRVKIFSRFITFPSFASHITHGEKLDVLYW